MNRNHVDPTLTKYLGSIVAIALNIALVLGILGYFGVETTSFAALIAGAGVAIGVAWSGLLGNFAAGAFLLILCPFKVGDFVAVARIKEAVAAIPNVAETPPAEVNLLDLRPEGPLIAVRPHAHNTHYWQVWFDTNEAIVRVGSTAGWPTPAALHQVKQM